MSRRAVAGPVTLGPTPSFGQTPWWRPPRACQTRRVTTEHLTTGAATLDRCADLISADPIGCNLAATVIARGDDGAGVIRVSDDSDTLGVAVEWGPGNTLMRLRDGAHAPIADALPSTGRTRLDGEVRDTAAVAGHWSERTGGSFETIEIFRVYRLAELRSPDVIGSAGVADAAHVDTAASWAVAFGGETGLGGQAADADDEAELDARRAQMQRAAAEGRLRVWRVAGEVVAQLIVSTPCFATVRIGGVYTPPGVRRKGYGAALTAAVAAAERARPDVDEVMLNTQALNALTNRLYRRLGFESVYEMLLVWLDAPAD